MLAELYQSDMKEDLKFQFKSKGYGDKRISWNHLYHSRTEEYATFRIKSVEGVPGSGTRYPAELRGGCSDVPTEQCPLDSYCSMLRYGEKLKGNTEIFMVT